MTKPYLALNFQVAYGSKFKSLKLQQLKFQCELQIFLNLKYKQQLKGARELQLKFEQ